MKEDENKKILRDTMQQIENLQWKSIDLNLKSGKRKKKHRVVKETNNRNGSICYRVEELASFLWWPLWLHCSVHAELTKALREVEILTGVVPDITREVIAFDINDPQTE